MKFIIYTGHLLLLAYRPHFEKIQKPYEMALLSVPPTPPHVKTGIMDPVETDVATQRLGKHLPAATHTTIELLDAVFYMPSVPQQILNIVKGK
jgi:hypothetical protein